jgi:hypothetical protein
MLADPGPAGGSRRAASGAPAGGAVAEAGEQVPVAPPAAVSVLATASLPPSLRFRYLRPRLRFPSVRPRGSRPARIEGMHRSSPPLCFAWAIARWPPGGPARWGSRTRSRQASSGPRGRRAPARPLPVQLPPGRRLSRPAQECGRSGLKHAVPSRSLASREGYWAKTPGAREEISERPSLRSSLVVESMEWAVRRYQARISGTCTPRQPRSAIWHHRS